MKKLKRFSSLFLALAILFPSIAYADTSTEEVLTISQDELQVEKENNEEVDVVPIEENVDIQNKNPQSEEIEGEEELVESETSEETSNTDDTEASSSKPSPLKDLVFDDKAERISGNDPYESSVLISRTFLDKQNKVIIASGESYPDALAATNLVQGKYPILFTESDSLPTIVKDEILRLEPEEVVLLGGSATISDQVENEIADLLGDEAKLTRIFGPTRYETTVETAKYTENTRAILADGLNHPDAITSSGLSFVKKQSILLTSPDALPEATKSYLASGVIKNLDIAGGEASVSENVTSEVRSLAIEIFERYSGKNRAATSVAIAEEIIYMRGYPTSVIICNGDSYQEALASSLISQNFTSPILLVGKDTIDPSVSAFLNKYKESIDKIIIVGNEDQVNANQVKFLEKAILDGGTNTGNYLPYQPLKRGITGQNVKLFHEKL